MVLAAARVRPAVVGRRRVGLVGDLIRSVRDARVDGLVRLASVGTVVSAVALVLLALGMYAIAYRGDHVVLATAATALFLPLYVRHLHHALRGARPTGAAWSLAAIAALILGPTPFLSQQYWVYMFHALAASAFVVLRPRWAITACVGLSVAAALAVYSFQSYSFDEVASLDDGGAAVWLAFNVVTRSLAPVSLVWCVAGLRQLEAARLALADQAVQLERRKIDDELERAVAADLASLVSDGERISECVVRLADDARVRMDLRSVVDRSRRTLAEARGMLRRYSLPLRAELQTAATVLRAAGIDVTVEAPDGDLHAALEPALRTSLRELTAELLHDEPAGPVVITLVGSEAVRALDRRDVSIDTIPTPEPAA